MTNQYEQVLAGRTALVTGASRGIGAAIALAYARAGAKVILVSRNTKALEKLDDQIREAGGQATLIPLDLLDHAKIDTLGPALAQKFGGLDIFVGNAGMLGTLGPLGHTEAHEWDRVIALNLSANFRLLRTLDPLLRASPAGRVIFVTSGAAEGYRAYWGAYAASKAGLESLARTYKAETEKTNICVNIVDPGEDPQTLPAPDYIVNTFLQLASAGNARNGDRIKAQG